ncbi:distal tail protein Dit [Brochothrix thermosphacta]|uniref:distal tail protein Dit n=1 Tax=Brochothrix thermosphacta TaxID=2756 RepID=UPI0039AF8C2F
MAEITFNYCGFDSKKDFGIVLNDINRPITAEFKEQVTEIPGMLGDLYEGTSLGGKKFELEVSLLTESESDRVYTLRELANVLTQTADGDEYPLIFSDEPDVTWWVHPTSTSMPERLNRSSAVSFTMSFTCSEGVGYQTKEEIQLTEETTVYTPKGNTTTRPVLTLTTESDLTKIGVSNGDEYVYLGAGFDVENQDAPINLKPRVLNDPCNTLASWTKITPATLSFNIENGSLSTDSDMTTTDNAIKIGNKGGKSYFGKNPLGVGGKTWFGPVRQQMLSKELEDWQVTARMRITNKYPRAKNKMELYLLDKKGTRIGKMMIKDNENSLENLIDLQIGYASQSGKYKAIYSSDRDGQGKTTKKNKLKPKKISFKTIAKVTDKKNKIKKGDVISKAMTVEQSNEQNVFTDFYGNLTIKKQGNKYTATVEKINKKGLSNKKYTKTFTDSDNKYGDKLAGVALYLSKWDIKEDTSNPVVEYTPNYLSLADVKVYEILGKQKQIVAEKGDEIIIDCENNVVYRNGIRYLENVSIGSQFFDAEAKQENVVTVYPEPGSKNKWELHYVPRIN